MLRIFADRGGTFTDIVAVTNNETIIDRLANFTERFLIVPLPNKEWIIVYKLLSENPEQYEDAVIQGIRDIIGLTVNEPIPYQTIEVVKMGTTVATNALLERHGDRVVLLITKGFKDALRIGYQNRPNIFAQEIILPTMLYEQVIEVDERYDAHGHELVSVNIDQAKQDLQTVYHTGIRSCAIVFMHSDRYPFHEQQIAKIAQEIGFTQISVSHQVSPLMKLVSRGDTTVVDAYLTPILRRYVNQIASHLPQVKLMFMKSDGGLTNAEQFQGKDSILSGPAGGIVGAVQTSKRAGFELVITFDMGGTSTDVAHFKGEYERQLDSEIAGARMRVPVLAINTIAAGGGSILYFDGSSYRVGPESAGSNPGPASYRRGGQLTVTDANVMLGKIQPEYFPAVFGSEGKLPLDQEIVIQKFTELAKEIASVTGNYRTPEQVASGFIAIAVENMANAIKKISLQRGYDVSQYVLCCFGGAGGQVACLIADTLGMKKIFLHPFAGVLSAYGMGLADIRATKITGVEQPLNESLIPQLEQLMASLETQSRRELNIEEIQFQQEIIKKVNLKYAGTNSILTVDFTNVAGMREQFESEHKLRYGFMQSEKDLIIESISVEVIQKMDTPEEPLISRTRPENVEPKIMEIVKMFSDNQWYDTPVYRREDLQLGDRISHPAIIVEKISTIIVEPNWEAKLTELNHLILERIV
ncbi:hydantoinase/oxoprolinase family protein [Aphanizomenon flos-aquae FACHB-1416]|jgi:5-oxoprolinase (ATP-hydrolysing)|uniref:hydantoinase/oxoprolinase family protein n=1 Tax=Aphanizomenon flos-aquae TaxID=1176 RepID=UPI0007FD05A1|nr:hydantoinase/oxoprolinase family protein [Aphanizomenon flos-aquae]OBQ28971.1 MAG: hydantoinase [Aphanizomenon flos-aquae MDT14a]MBD2389367.1 hydantoinase/oxoprolinase family protein [Aphanizomenon flos-aquae FACHB-1171]MBD2557701.1 hydantoinase/oxoprolinase family protein [Aphanizomenon flos-aquae FACHB-1290]MBD2656427.1 hydantoinase/oxoprolinase family protein [Aphanizomenon flos-aquae FACHB-1265]MBD2672605.1 hydantoinase/oxoprolinase family protein [Aphanizomenon flos-aquae FACHB-1416]